jgi:hypothetical protein
MTDERSPFHFGGPLGLAGLAIFAGALGLAGLTGAIPAVGAAPLEQPAKAPTENSQQPVAPAPSKPVVSTPVRPPAADPAAKPVTKPTAKPAVPQNPKRVATKPPVSADLPATKPPLPPKGAVSPAGDPGVQPARAAASAAGEQVIFIVRIKGADEIDEIARAFKKDRAAADKSFAALTRARPALAKFTLVGASYSGEIRLAYTLGKGETASHDAIKRLQDQLLEVEGVAYADPDGVAHPGKDESK